MNMGDLNVSSAVFFFKQKTSYEVRLSDWSSYVCSSDLGRIPEGVGFAPDGRHFYVANFKDNDVWIFRVDGQEVTDTGRRLKLPGRPASARTTPATPNVVVR